MSDSQSFHVDSEIGAIYTLQPDRHGHVAWIAEHGYTADELPKLIAFLQEALRESNASAAKTTTPNGRDH